MISEELERLKQAKTEIRTAIEAKGVTVPPESLISSYPLYVDRIKAEPQLRLLTVNRNGVYEPPRGYDGFAGVNVEVPTAGGMSVDVAKEKLKFGFAPFEEPPAGFIFDNVVDYSFMFERSKIKYATKLSFFKAVDCTYMFQNAEELLEFSGATGNVQNFYCMFHGCLKLRSLSLSTAGATSIYGLIENCPALTAITSVLDVSKVQKNESLSGLWESNLVEVHIHNLSGKGINLELCKKLSKSSVEELIRKAKNICETLGQGYIHLAKATYDKISPEIMKIATDKGWIVTSK